MHFRLALLMTILPALPLQAEGRFALVLAVQEYETLRDLDNPLNDALAIATELDRLGFEVTLEPDRDARRTRRALEDFAEDASGADIALVYFAGHGVEIAGENHILPVDTDPSSITALTETAISLAELAEVLTEIAPTAILLIDACRDDPFAGTALAAAGRSAKPLEGEGSSKAFAVAPGFARVGRADGLLYGFATGPGAVALDGEGKNSPYAEALLRHLGKDGLSLPTILTLVAQDVYDRSGNRQLPYFESALPDLVFISSPSPELSERDALLLNMAGLTPELRAEVERIASLNDVPLAPLYAAMLSADLASLTLTEREAQLTAAAAEYRAFIAQVAAPGEDDPRILALRDEAAALMRLGAYGEAQAKYDQALALGTARSDSASDELMAETLSLIETLKASAFAAQATLDHETAIARYRQIADELGKIEALGLPHDAMIERTNALWSISIISDLTGDLAGAEAASIAMQEVLASRIALDPQNGRWLSDLSASLGVFGDIRLVLGDLSGAEAAYLKALELDQDLAAHEPDSPLRKRDLSISWDRVGAVRKARADLAGAEEAFRSALLIQHELVALDPSNAEWQHGLSHIWERIGDIRLDRWDLDGAEAAQTDALKIRQILAELTPQSADFQRSLSVSWEKTGDLRRNRGDLAGAQDAYEASLAIRLELARRDPQNTLWQRDLSVSWYRIGAILSDLAQIAEADQAFGQALQITLTLTARDPRNTEWQGDLLFGWERAGDMHLARGALVKAADAYGEALDVAKRLAEIDPLNLLWQRNVSIVLTKIGDLHTEDGNTAGAEAAYGEALQIAEVVADRDPANEEWQRDVSIAWDKVGDLRRERGDLAGAEAAYQHSLNIMQKLADSNAAMASIQIELVVSHVRLASVTETPRPHLKAALEILERLQTIGELPPENVDWIAIIRAEMLEN